MKLNQPFTPSLLTACLSGTLCFLYLVGVGFAGQGVARHSPPAPFSPDETQHGFFQFETLPPIPEDTAPDPLDYYRNEQPGSFRLQDDLQNGTQDGPPGGLFQQITTARGFDENLDVRRGHLYYPIQPTETFAPDTSAVYVVFRVFKHYAPYYVIGRLVPEHVPGLSDETAAEEDTASLALEDESGYLQFFAPSQDGQAGWHPGRYRIDIFVGYEASELTRMGALRFTIAPRA